MHKRRVAMETLATQVNYVRNVKSKKAFKREILQGQRKSIFIYFFINW